jgi:DNA-binding response OmpR family regulator
MEAPTEPESLEGLRILLVEDDPLILLDLDTSLSELGAAVAATTESATALELIRTSPLDFAILDFELGAQTSEPIAVAAQAASLPFLFLSGYSENDEHFVRWPGIPVLVKPISIAALSSHIRSMLGPAAVSR